MEIRFTKKISWLFFIMFCLTIKTMAQTVPSYVPTNGLVGWWPFNGNAQDESGNGNHGTVNGAALTSDRSGNLNKAYSFNGINNFINMPYGEVNSLNISSNLAISFWFKTSNTNEGLIGFGDNINSNGGGFLAAIGNGISGNPVGKLTSMTGGIWYTGSRVINDNNWHLVCINLNGNSLTFVIDNQIDTSFAEVKKPLPFNGSRAIGARNNGLAGFFNGKIDDVAFWNRALTESEIEGLFKATSNNHTITASSGANGSITPSGVFEVPSQSSKRFVFTPATGYQIDSVLVNNQLVDSLIGYTFSNITSNQTIRVTFKKVNIPSYIPTNGLVGWWPFNGNAQDESGNGNHGTVNGATLTSDRFMKNNSAYTFDGIDDFIKTIKTNVSGTGSRTYSIWFLSEKNVGQSNKILTDEGGTACGSGFATLQYPSNNIVFDNTCNPKVYNYFADVYIWNQVVMIFDDKIASNLNGIKCYLNGALISNATISGNSNIITGNSIPLTIGKSRLGSDHFFVGKIDDIAIWNRALTDSEIKDLYNASALVVSPCQQKDSLELVNFKNNIPNLSWNIKNPMKSWQGVKVNTSGCVTHLLLNDLGLSGTLTDLKLDSLIELELIGNKFTGSIPSFSNLKKLKALWLSGNQLSGSVPNFQLSELQTIDLANNNLSGSIPAFNLSNLTELGLANNKLTGVIPTLNTPKLAWIRLNNNALTGNIPNWTFQDLQGIYLQSNNLSGSLPDLKLNDLRHFNVDSNALQGSLKHNFPNLWEINLANNKFTSLTDLVTPSLGLAIFHRNQFSGNLNTGFSQYVNLEKLRFENNKWTFEALVPISTYLNDKKGSYSPQEFIYPDTIIKSNAGKALEIDLVIDASIKDNTYTWFKEGKPFKTLTGNNKMLFSTLQLSDTGNYQVFVTHPSLKNLTLSSRNIKIQIPCLPTQSVRNDTICAGTSLAFAGQTITKEGPYTGRFTSVQGCDSTVTLNLVVRPVINAVPMSFIDDCRIFASVDVSGGVSPIQYAWSNGGKGAEISDLSPETNYTLTLTDAKGCKKEISLKTPSFKRLAIIPTYKTANCEKENGEIKLAITGTAPFIIDWGKNTLGSGDTLRTGLVSGSYTVFVKDANDCKDSLPMYLEKPTDCKPSYKVFTSFSPNDDGVNDIFTIDPLYCTSEDLATCFPNNELIIFNRWSDVVFKASPYNNTWEGEGLPEGTYYYIFTADREFKKSEKGYITLIKRQ
jgi:gliding motility-associated-like protein